MENAIVKCPITGPVELNIDEVVKQWDDRCLLVQWHTRHDDNANIRLVQYEELGKEDTCLKVTISWADADELILRLGLLQVPDSVFRNGSTWKLPKGAKQTERVNRKVEILHALVSMIEKSNPEHSLDTRLKMAENIFNVMVLDGTLNDDYQFKNK